jgi:hypothetical protein
LPGDQEVYGPDTLPLPQPGVMIWRGGHVSYGLHVVYDAVPRYCTVLREPIDRLISEFFYAHAQANFFLPEGERLDAFCRYVEAAPHLNYYGYMYSAYCFQRDAWNGTPAHVLEILRLQRKRLAHLSNLIDYTRVEPSVAFDASVEALMGFEHVGIYERLVDTRRWFSRLGIDIDLNPRLNVTSEKCGFADLPPATQRALHEKTRFDRALYDRFKDRGEL